MVGDEIVSEVGVEVVVVGRSVVVAEETCCVELTVLTSDIS